MGLYVRETFTNLTEETIFGETGWYETPYDSPGEIYRFALAEYGRCAGKVYVDQADGGVRHVGWTFVKRDEYDDSNETYLREVWVTFRAGEEVAA
jgi:hypothetical protein